MTVFESLNEVSISGRTAVLLGKFDGMHRGHRKLLARAKELCVEEDLQLAVFMITVSPVTILSKAESTAMLSDLGVDILVHVPLNKELMTMGPEQFVSEILCDKLKAYCVVVGEDYHFGFHRVGDARILSVLGRTYDYICEAIPALLYEGEKISSTNIRSFLADGEIEKANTLLGYPYYLSGEVVHGRALGRTIGVPTANIIPDRDKLLPAFGVYITKTYVKGHVFTGITNIGRKPTVNGQVTSAETYLFDCDEDLYGTYQKTELLHFVRPETRFESLEALREQLSRDIEEGRSYFL